MDGRTGRKQYPPRAIMEKLTLSIIIIDYDWLVIPKGADGKHVISWMVVYICDWVAIV